MNFYEFFSNAFQSSERVEFKMATGCKFLSLSASSKVVCFEVCNWISKPFALSRVGTKKKTAQPRMLSFNGGK